jgi:hypothetical protein
MARLTDYLLSRLRDLLNLTRSLKPSLIPGYGDSPLSVYGVSCSEHCARLGAVASSCQPLLPTLTLTKDSLQCKPFGPGRPLATTTLMLMPVSNLHRIPSNA